MEVVAYFSGENSKGNSSREGRIIRERNGRIEKGKGTIGKIS